MKLFLGFVFSLFSYIAIAQITYNPINYNVELIYSWKDTTLVPSIYHDNTYNEVWGFVQDGKEYGVIGSTAGTHIFDLSKFWNIRQVAFIPGETQGGKLVHRDYHDYKGYLYIVSDENDTENGDTSKLKIVDLSYLPDSVHVVYNSKEFFTRSHNIFIDSANAKLYTCGGDKNPGIRVFSLANPIQPVEVSSVALSSSTHDVYVRNDTAYINCAYDGLFIYDFSDNNNPQLIGSLTSYPQQGYNHSGWLSDDGKTYIMADENHNFDIKILDVSDLNNIIVVDTIDTSLDTNYTIPHNIMIKGDHLFVSYYFDGMYVFNIADPANSYVSGYYHTSHRIHQNNKYEGNWGVYCLLPSGFVLASDMQNGLFVFDVDKAVGINEKEPISNKVICYPNPATETVIFPELNDNFSYLLIDITGKLIDQAKLKNNAIKIKSNIKNGTYFVILKFENEVYSKQIEIKN